MIKAGDAGAPGRLPLASIGTLATIEPTRVSEILPALPSMAFQLTVIAVCVAILLVAGAIFRHLMWLGKKRKPGQSLFLLDTLTDDPRPGKPRKRRPE